LTVEAVDILAAASSDPAPREANRQPDFTCLSHRSLREVTSDADTEDVDDQDAVRSRTCDEIRSTRLHYQLRCRLTAGHEGDHQWTPELLTADPGSTAATG
jgi:hypothetical protein